MNFIVFVGRIVEWNMKKELENTELMGLKKT